MAGKYGKDSPERFISGALDGGTRLPDGGMQNTSTSDEIFDKGIGRGQKIKTALALDNVGDTTYGNIESSIKTGKGFGGSPGNLSHSLEGVTANQTKPD
jgi:hypothetical protein